MTLWRPLPDMQRDDTAASPMWFIGPASATAKAIRDRRDLLVAVQRLREQLIDEGYEPVTDTQ